MGPPGRDLSLMASSTPFWWAHFFGDQMISWLAWWLSLQKYIWDHTHRIHGTGIFSHIRLIFTVNVKVNRPVPWNGFLFTCISLYLNFWGTQKNGINSTKFTGLNGTTGMSPLKNGGKGRVWKTSLSWRRLLRGELLNFGRVKEILQLTKSFQRIIPMELPKRSQPQAFRSTSRRSAPVLSRSWKAPANGVVMGVDQAAIQVFVALRIIGP